MTLFRNLLDIHRSTTNLHCSSLILKRSFQSHHLHFQQSVRNEKKVFQETLNNQNHDFASTIEASEIEEVRKNEVQSDPALDNIKDTLLKSPHYGHDSTTSFNSYSNQTLMSKLHKNALKRENKHACDILEDDDVDHSTKFKSEREYKKEVFIHAIDLYVKKGGRRRDHLEFITSALKQMKKYGVEKDLECYKKLLDVMPKGKFIIKNIFQEMFYHYPKHQKCIFELIVQMHKNTVFPDLEFGLMLNNIFGENCAPTKYYYRMLYWMPRISAMNPWPVPLHLPEDSRELAVMAIKRITSPDPFTDVKIFTESQLPHSATERTWIVSGVAPDQRRMMKQLIPEKDTLFIEGPFRVHLRSEQVNYFVLRGKSVVIKDKPSEDSPTRENLKDLRIWTLGHQSKSEAATTTNFNIHQQEDATIFGCCATGTSSRDSLLSWIRLLTEENVALENVPILFSMTSSFGPVVKVDSDSKQIHTTT